jgi:hypothetical protein
MHRLNRAEYQNATRDLLGIDTDVASFLPADDASYGFDNIAGVLRFSPVLMEKYLAAAGKVSRAAVGTPAAAPNFDVFRVPDDLPQDDHIEGLPLGTRGGTLIRYNFPADGEYLIKARLARQTAGQDLDVPRYDQPQELEISVDGNRIAVFTLRATRPTPGMRNNFEYRPAVRRQPNKPADTVEPEEVLKPPAPEQPAATAAGADPAEEDEPKYSTLGGPRANLDGKWDIRFSAKAGPHDIAVTFLNRTAALRELRVEPYELPFAVGTNTWTPRRGAYLQRVEISGPFQPVGAGDTPSRAKIFVCKPASPAEETPCARAILGRLARRAYRRPVAAADVDVLMKSYEAGRDDEGFEGGITRAIQRLLVSPEFLFRVSADPAGVPPSTAYRISDLELASRLSFFLWSSIPDDELLGLAANGTLSDRAVLERQVRRLLADDRSQALVENFVGQWLLLRNVPALRPDPNYDPDFDESLRRAMRKETELFLDSIIREDRSVVDLLAANYTFLNERLARHYGIPNVSGSHFRRVTFPEGSVRGGLLGQGAILAVTSQPNRTSPVLRGKWILENILGTPPPPPPADVPALDEKKNAGTALTMRERMAEHRSNPVCFSCHAVMDPLGLSLENFDSAGRWRTVDKGFELRRSTFTPIDATGSLPDGTKFEGPAGLKTALLGHPDLFVTTMTERLLTYALGRGLDSRDMPVVRRIVREAEANQYRFSSLLMAVVNSVPFRMRTSAGPAMVASAR